MALVTVSKILLQQNYSNSQGVGYHGLSCIMALKQLCVIVTKETSLSVYVSIVTSSRGIVVIDGGMLITVFLYTVWATSLQGGSGRSGTYTVYMSICNNYGFIGIDP